MYALIQEIKNDDINIVTLEDPVEYKMDGVNQIQVNSEVGLTFATGLRSILRQDPDVVLVGAFVTFTPRGLKIHFEKLEKSVQAEANFFETQLRLRPVDWHMLQRIWLND